MDNCLAPLPPTAASTSSSSTSLLTNEYETVHLINGNGNDNGELEEKVSSSSSSHVTNERIALKAKTASTGYMEDDDGSVAKKSRFNDNTVQVDHTQSSVFSSPSLTSNSSTCSDHHHNQKSSNSTTTQTTSSSSSSSSSSSTSSSSCDHDNPNKITSNISTTSNQATTIQKANNALPNIINNDIQNPRQLLAHLMPSFDMSKLPATFDDFDICRLVYQIMSTNSGDSEGDGDGGDLDLANLELDSSSAALNHAAALSSWFLTPRQKLNEFNTLDDCLDLIEKSHNVIVLTGAGCSVSCGIPDFRSRDGVYARLRVDFPDLPDPQSMFDILYFEHDPRPFFKFAKEIYPGQFRPSLSHRFIKKLELKSKLLRNYTQNIDTLENAAQINNVIQCHGSFATATCTTCKYKVDCDYIKDRIFEQKIPYCDKCNSNSSNTPEKEINNADSFSNELSQQTRNASTGILKPDIVFFGEGLPEIYHKSINDDKNKCDLLIVIGSSLKVKPVANIPLLLPKHIPQILINRESLKHMNFDVELLGDCDVIVNELLLRLEQRRLANIEKERDDNIDWADICQEKKLLNKIEDEEADKLVFSVENKPSTGDENENSEDNSLDETTGHDDEKKTAFDLNQSETACDTKNDDTIVNRVYTKDYLKESSFVHLKPNIHIFHGAEISLRFMYKKLKRLRKAHARYVNGEEADDEANGTQKREDEDEFDELDTDEDDFLDEEDTEEEEEEEDDDDECGSGEDEEEEGGEDENECSLKKLMEMQNESDDEEESDDDFSLVQQKKELKSKVNGNGSHHGNKVQENNEEHN